jgi:hypothetical protein
MTIVLPVILVVSAGEKKSVDVSQLMKGIFQNRIVTIGYHVPQQFIGFNTFLWISN